MYNGKPGKQLRPVWLFQDSAQAVEGSMCCKNLNSK